MEPIDMEELPALSKVEGGYLIEHLRYGVVSHSRTYEGVWRQYRDDMEYQRRALVDVPDSELSEDAIKVKRHFLAGER